MLGKPSSTAKIYVANIRDGLIQVDPDGAAAYRANADAYIEKLTALEAEVVAAIAKFRRTIAKLSRRMTPLAISETPMASNLSRLKGVSTETEASARDVAKIIRQIKAQKIPAVFLENISDPRVAQRIAEESGAKIGGTLFSDALSPPDGPGSNYIDMMRNNIKELSAALAK